MMNNIKNNRLIWIVLLMWLCFLAPAHADSKKEGIDVQDIVIAEPSTHILHNLLYINSFDVFFSQPSIYVSFCAP